MNIAATISKNYYDDESIRSIIQKGAAMIRINGSHGTNEEIIDRYHRCRSIIAETHSKAQIMLDIPGNKIRLGDIGQDIAIGQGETYNFTIGSSDLEMIPIDTAAENLSAVQVGQTIYIGDGDPVFTVTATDPNHIQARADSAGTIRSFAGVSFSNLADFDTTISDRGREIIDLCHTHDIHPDVIALSFVDSPEDWKTKCNVIHNRFGNYTGQLCAKIETTPGVLNIDDIVKDKVDIVMIARGDLLLLSNFESLGSHQMRIISSCKKHNVPVMVATEITHSLVDHYLPNRSEIAHISYLVRDQVDWILLTKETGIAQDPGRSVAIVKSIIDHSATYAN